MHVFSHVDVVGDCLTHVRPSQQLGLQLPPAFLHMHSDAAAQMVWPVPYVSEQHPVSQSEFLLQAFSQSDVASLTFVHVSPSQHLSLRQDDPAPVQRPATAPGLEQVGFCLPAGPVQKHDASSYVMHWYARQYGRSLVLGWTLSPESEPGGMQT